MPRRAAGLRWFEQGQAHEAAGRPTEALEAYRSSLREWPQAAAPWVGLARLLAANQQHADACECLRRAVGAEPGNAPVRAMFAQALAATGRTAEAEAEYRAALAAAPGPGGARLGPGGVLEDRGRPAEAAAAYRACLAHPGERARAFGSLLGLGRHVDLAADLPLANEALDEASDADAAQIGYGLGKELERRGEHDRAFAAWAAANAARRRDAGPFDRAAFDRQIDTLIDTFAPAFFAGRAGWGDLHARPLFVVGLPRSGTTLTEQILASHPACHGAGELDALSDLATGAPDRLGSAAPAWPRCAPDLAPEQIRALAADYLVRARATVPAGVAQVIDKAPLNFFHLGLVALAFPRARIVHCTRDPRDNGLSIFAENFAREQRWATDLADIAHYRQGYRRLMAHWQAVSPLAILEHRYEDAVADPEPAVRRLLAFAGLPWDPACLTFHDNPRAVQTPSRWQVRQPVYTASSGRWRRFEKHLGALTPDT
ncbi:MAG TPA: sulfotransferase [Croceibacterium sp.]